MVSHRSPPHHFDPIVGPHNSAAYIGQDGLQHRVRRAMERGADRQIPPARGIPLRRGREVRRIHLRHCLQPHLAIDSAVVPPSRTSRVRNRVLQQLIVRQYYQAVRARMHQARDVQRESRIRKQVLARQRPVDPDLAADRHAVEMQERTFARRRRSIEPRAVPRLPLIQHIVAQRLVERPRHLDLGPRRTRVGAIPGLRLPARLRIVAEVPNSAQVHRPRQQRGGAEKQQPDFSDHTNNVIAFAAARNQWLG